jgi:hypothetical protein
VVTKIKFRCFDEVSAVLRPGDPILFLGRSFTELLTIRVPQSFVTNSLTNGVYRHFVIWEHTLRGESTAKPIGNHSTDVA